MMSLSDPTPANACSCEKCAGACEHKPGWFKPEEIAPLAAALGLSEKELFDRHLMVDWWNGDEDTDWEDVFLLSPAIIGGDVGDMFDRNPRGTCAWLKDGKCEVHTLGKPFECAAYYHSDEESRWKDSHKAAAMAWNKPEHQDRIRALLGREPEAESWSIFDEMGLGSMWA